MARILVIDDEHNIRLMIRLALRAVGHEVQEAADGPEGLALYGDGSGCDVVLLDQRMPTLSGLEVLGELRLRQSAAKVIMITAFGTVDLAAEALRAGASDFLRKPFTTEVLRSAVQSALDAAPPVAALAAAPLSFKATSINGFRLAGTHEASSDAPRRHVFVVQTPEGASKHCTVLLPDYFRELVKAHLDQEMLEDTHFWNWLSEEALANYLWQNAELPPGEVLQVEELTSGLRRWIEAVAP